MKKEEFFLPSSDGINNLHCISWLPEGEIKCVLQIVHGMVEYVDRYDDFARFLTTHGAAVVGHDHLGHGLTAKCDDDLGYFAPVNPSDVLIDDIYKVTKYIKSTYPNVPNYILGHSMGSFLTRKYLTLYSGEVDKAIIMGTGHMPLAVVSFARRLSGAVGAFHGDRHRSAMITNVAFGSYNKKFAFPKSSYAWLTKDEKLVAAHDAEKLSTFIFTINGYKGLFDTLIYLSKWQNFNNIRRDLPVLLVSGKNDPVGDYGKAPVTVYEEYKKRGMQDVTLKLYNNDRHEILNELDKAQVYDDITAWLLGGE